MHPIMFLCCTKFESERCMLVLTVVYCMLLQADFGIQYGHQSAILNLIMNTAIHW